MGSLCLRTAVTERWVVHWAPSVVLKHNASLRLWGEVTGNARNVVFGDGERKPALVARHFDGVRHVCQKLLLCISGHVNGRSFKWVLLQSLHRPL